MENPGATGPTGGGRARIVLTAPLTEIIDHAGYFIQMSMASLPMWLEGILNKKYPEWRKVEYNDDGTARYMPAGVRVLEESLLRRSPPTSSAATRRTWTRSSVRTRASSPSRRTIRSA